MARDAARYAPPCPVGHFPTGSRVRMPPPVDRPGLGGAEASEQGRTGTIRETIDGPSGIEWAVWFDDAVPGSGLIAVRTCDAAEVAPEGSRGAEPWQALPRALAPAEPGAAS